MKIARTTTDELLPYQLFVRADNAPMRRGPRFRRLTDAIKHAHIHREEASYAIRKPDGRWHQWDSTGSVVLPRRGARSAIR